MKPPPKRRRYSSLATELLSRPALNGGWEKLVKQQDEQSKDIKHVRTRLRKTEMWISRWDSRWKWLIGLVGTTSVAVVAKIMVEILVRAKILP